MSTATQVNKLFVSNEKVSMFRIDARTKEFITADLPIGRGWNNGAKDDSYWRKLGWKPIAEMPKDEVKAKKNG